MKNQEFLDILGDVDERYVLAADGNVVRPKFRWQPWAAAAACAALICAAAYPRLAPGFSNGGTVPADCAPPMGDGADDAIEDAGAEEPDAESAAGTLVQAPGLHDYFLFEEDRQLMTMTTQGELKAPAAGMDNTAEEDAPVPAPAPNAASFASGAFEDAPADIPQDVDNPYAGGAGEIQPFINQAEAISQYQNLLNRGGIGYAGEGYYPEWFAGAWLDNDWPDNTARLTVAMVDGWRTEAMENMVRGWCGGTRDVLFCTAKYSYAHLNGLMDEISAVFDQYGWLTSVIAANEETNRVDLEIYGSVPSDEFLAELAKLDPDGDAIRVQVFTDGTIQLTDDTAMKPLAPAVEPEPAPPTPPEEPDEVCGLPLAEPEGE